ncbi:permease [Lentilactobacillus buchneri]|mgnify:FL=1|nr:permease [Lentilactobacillus buchneri]MCT2897431.1 permease [Lentilactobacillus buchneri]MCT3251977.1 permease [Lentilactobacillus buchneri]MCT3546566.1 permease [Lentilactobacillus buchneri]MCT3555140.1 permease [Lentilactobacillus buchneri]
MLNERRTLELPDALKAQLGVKSGEHVEVRIGADELKISTPKPVEVKKRRWGMIILTFVMSCVFLGYFMVRKIYQVSLVGSESVATMVLLLTTLSGLMSFMVVFVRLKRQSGSAVESVSWRNLPTVALAFALISFMLMAGLFWIAGRLFKGASFDLVTSTALFALMTSVEIQAINSLVPQLSSRLLTNIFIAVIVSGVILAMISNQNLYWWKHNLSFLGTNKAVDSWEFNLALFFSGLILLALVDYLFASLKRIFPKSRQLLVLRILLTLLAIDLGMVGAFPNNLEIHSLHTRLAGYLIFLILGLIFGIRWLLPDISTDFQHISWMIAAALLAGEILFQVVGYLSLTAFEIMAFLLAFSWLVMLFERLNDYLEPIQNQRYVIK